MDRSVYPKDNNLSARDQSLLEILYQSNPYIRDFGPAGYEIFAASRNQKFAEEFSWETIAGLFIHAIDTGERSSPAFATELLKIYIAGEAFGDTPEIVKLWVRKCIMQVIEGVDPSVAFHLKLPVGKQRTDPMHDRLRCVCFVELQIRAGLSKSEAIENCAKTLKVGARQVYRFVKDIKINKHIADRTLQFYADRIIEEIVPVFDIKY